jgi:hypothetical protein
VGTVGVATQRAPYRWLVMDRLLRVSRLHPNHVTPPRSNPSHPNPGPNPDPDHNPNLNP